MSESAPSGLPRSFQWLNATQFFGALNDNFWQQVIVFALVSLAVIQSPGTNESDIVQTVSANVGLVFALPFLLFMAASGVIADRISKSRIIVMAKILEVGTMLLAVVAMYLMNATMMYVVLFLMCTQSTFFSPAKYGIIPEIVGEKGLSQANGQIQAFSYIAIITGVLLASFLSQATGQNFTIMGIACLALAFLGFCASLFIPKQPAAGSTEKINPLFVVDIFQTMKSIRHHTYLTASVYGLAFFLMVAAFVKIYIFPYASSELDFSLEQSALLFLFAAAGIGMGSWIAGSLSRQSIEFGIVPVGAVLIVLGTLSLALITPSPNLTRFFMFLIGFGGGLFIVPLNAFIQQEAPRDRLGQILAATNWIGWVGIIGAAFVVKLFKELDFNPRQGFFVIAMLSSVLAYLAVIKLPDFMFRFFLLVVTRLFYKVDVHGLKHVPQKGGALLICNHVSWIDALLIIATNQRRVRFMMSKVMLKQYPMMRPFAHLLNVIPVHKSDSRDGIEKSLAAARDAIAEGYLVCIFAEGHLSRTGTMFEFKRGFERIMEGRSEPIIPIYLGGAWGSITSYAYGKLFSRRPTRLPYPVSVLYGEPMPANSQAFEVRQRVLELSVDYFEKKKPSRKPLGYEYVKSARANGGKHAIADSLGQSLSFKNSLVGSVALADALRSELKGETNVGMILPTSAGGALANVAVAILGKVAVNLNYTAGTESFASAIEQAGLNKIIVSKLFMRKLPELPIPKEKLIYLEDLSRGISKAAKAKAWAKARFAPASMLCSTKGFHADDLACIIFSSGTTGTPKGVLLSHHNILSNIESFRMVFRPQEDDALCAALPFFHSFGYTTAIWFPLLSGFAVAYHPNPLEVAKIAELARNQKATMLVATPTFLSMYTRKASAEDFKTLRFCLVGAEKLKQNISDAFEEKFGVRPLEGYGATEASPVIAVNLPDVKLDGIRQKGAKPGSVGQPVPGIVVKVCDPDTGSELPQGESGLLWIKGPNVMQGYLGQPEKTAEVLQDGWYCTGDIANLGRDGFITLTDRLSRFSKIGGEMVPHIGVEEELHRLLEADEAKLVVAGIPDERKGERLVVLHLPGLDLDALKAKLDTSALPNLWKPSSKAWAEIEQLPILGSGKLDLKKVKQLAVDAFTR